MSLGENLDFYVVELEIFLALGLIFAVYITMYDPVFVLRINVMTIQTHFNKFDKNIYLTSQSAGYKKAREKDESILKEIQKAFFNAGYPVIDTFLQGSFAVGTAINSLDGDYDVDRAIVIDADRAPQDPVAPKKIILDVLNKRNFKNPRVKKPCVTADYQSVNLHIDYTVYKKKSSGFWGDSYYLAIGKVGSSSKHKEWSEADQKGLIDWIGKVEFNSGSTAKRKQMKRLIRYMKRWRDVTFNEEAKKKIFSIGLTVMIREQYSPSAFFSEIDDDLTALKKTVDNILNANYIRSSFFGTDYRIFTRLPKKPYRDIFQHKITGGDSADGSDLNIGTQLRNKLISLQSDLQKALDESDEIKQCMILNKVFGSDFIVPKRRSLAVY